MTRPVSIQNDEVFMKLWVNETFRVFYDRLINDEDREWFKNFVVDLVAVRFKMKADLQTLFAPENAIMFGDLLKLDSPV